MSKRSIIMKITKIGLAIILVVGSALVSHADINSDLNAEASRMNTLAASQGDSKVVNKIGSEFNNFLGADSKTVVNGLRNGTPITLTRTASTPGSAPVTTTTTINPPTGKTGFGNVFISLALAKQQLGQMGIAQPTPEQLNAALVGGNVTTGTGTTTLQGVLTMRSQNMGWGQIAQKMGFKLGPVVSGMKGANQSMTTASTTNGGTTNAGGQLNAGSESGIVSGSGKVRGNSGQGISGKGGSGQGIVSASGRPVDSGNAYGYGKGVVTGSGHGAGGNTAVTPGAGPGNSFGHGNGPNK
jgi:hypothetical protein